MQAFGDMISALASSRATRVAQPQLYSMVTDYLPYTWDYVTLCKTTHRSFDKTILNQKERT